MGEVYQARDTKLDRDVALKVLPEAFTADPDRLARFEREAKVLASLNHPNIGSIYGLEEAEGVKARSRGRRWRIASRKAPSRSTKPSLSPSRSRKPSKRPMSRASSTAISNRPTSR